MSAMSMRTATFFGSSGLTNVRMLVTPSGPNTSSRFGEASQCSVSFTSWCPITVGIASPLVHGAAGSPHSKARAYAHRAPLSNRPPDGSGGELGEFLVRMFPKVRVVLDFLDRVTDCAVASDAAFSPSCISRLRH